MQIDLESLYRDLHQHPELSWCEHRTSAVMAELLTELGYEVTTGIAGTGLVGILRNGDGPVVFLRADMDALPVREQTGVPYASTAMGTDPNGEIVPVMHACGHDIHLTCLVGAAEVLAQTSGEWMGTIVAICQPAEERDGGAARMIEDGLLSLVPEPTVVLGQHVLNTPAGTVGAQAGIAMAACDMMEVTMHGRGGHGSMPEKTIDPVLMAASTVVRLQSVVSREAPPSAPLAVTVGYLTAGTKSNIIPAEARMGISVRSFDDQVRTRALSAIERIIEMEARASGAERHPDIVYREQYPLTVNDPTATAATMAAFQRAFGADNVRNPGVLVGSEDVGVFSRATGAPLVYWILGGADPTVFASAEAAGTLDSEIPSNHSPLFAPLPQPTIDTGVRALVVAAREWLGVRSFVREETTSRH